MTQVSWDCGSTVLELLPARFLLMQTLEFKKTQLPYKQNESLYSYCEGVQTKLTRPKLFFNKVVKIFIFCVKAYEFY